MRTFLLTLPALLMAADPAPLAVRSATVGDQPVTAVIDGDRATAWTAPQAGAVDLDLDLGSTVSLQGVQVHTGPGSGIPRVISLQAWMDGRWVEVPSAQLEGNASASVALLVDGTMAVTTDRLRLHLRAEGAPATLREILVWPSSVGQIPPLHPPALDKKGRPVRGDDPRIPRLYLNQSGFNHGKPKRFTAPTLADGTAFVVRPASGGDPVAQGTITGHIGDFSTWDASDTREYVVEAGGLRSVPFRGGLWWLERISTQGTIDFMIDARHYLGTHTKPCKGSFGWRDDHHFGWELQALVAQYLSNPSAYERLPRQITYQAPTDPTLWGALQPPRDEAPDIVKLIHWGADVLVTQGRTHELLKTQLPYLLYAWPRLQEWLPDQNRQVVQDFVLKHWSSVKADSSYPYDESREHDLLVVKTKIGTTKGGYPPGFSVEPNVLMALVARRDGLPDPERFHRAAVAQVQWMAANLDWNDPQVTKGQRMSEFITMTGLATFAWAFPQDVTPALRASLTTWAQVVIRRSDNLWDFRKLADGEGPGTWTPMDPSAPQKWNEPGNVVGLPAAIYAVLSLLDDAAQRQRLEQIAWAHVDNFLGRNPTGRCFNHRAPQEIEGVEFGWYNRYQGGIGQLEKARFVIDGSPKDPLYPYQPEVGNIGWTEGWIQFNTPFMASLATMATAESSLALNRRGRKLDVRLVAPLGFDPQRAETARVWVTAGKAPAVPLTLTEASVHDRAFVGTVDVPPGAVEVTYGYGRWGTSARVP